MHHRFRWVLSLAAWLMVVGPLHPEDGSVCSHPERFACRLGNFFVLLVGLCDGGQSRKQVAVVAFIHYVVSSFVVGFIGIVVAAAFLLRVPGETPLLTRRSLKGKDEGDERK